MTAEYKAKAQLRYVSEQHFPFNMTSLMTEVCKRAATREHDPEPSWLDPIIDGDYALAVKVPGGHAYARIEGFNIPDDGELPSFRLDTVAWCDGCENYHEVTDALYERELFWGRGDGEAAPNVYVVPWSDVETAVTYAEIAALTGWEPDKDDETFPISKEVLAGVLDTLKEQQEEISALLSETQLEIATSAPDGFDLVAAMQRAMREIETAPLDAEFATHAHEDVAKALRDTYAMMAGEAHGEPRIKVEDYEPRTFKLDTPATAPDRDNYDLEKGGVKFDAGKARMDLIPMDAALAVAQVFTYGARKYDDWNWAKGMRRGRLVAAMMRHIAADQLGEVFDEESGLPHTWHIGCCALMLIAADMRGISQEDGKLALAALDAFRLVAARTRDPKAAS